MLQIQILRMGKNCTRDSQCDSQLPASKVHIQAFTTTQGQAVQNDQLCAQWQQSHFSHKLTLCLTLYLRICLSICISVTSSELSI